MATEPLDAVLTVPVLDEVSPLLIAAIPRQLCGFLVLIRRRVDVDQPRNLVKSVTVK